MQRQLILFSQPLPMRSDNKKEERKYLPGIDLPLLNFTPYNP